MKSLKSILSESVSAEDTLTHESVFDVNKSNPTDFLIHKSSILIRYKKSLQNL